MGKIRNDIILIISIALLIIGLFVFWIIKDVNKPEKLYVNIYSDEKLVYSLPIDEDKEITINGKIGEVHIIIKDSYVWVSEADCPNHICEDMGKKNKERESIICLPNLIVITIGGKADE